MGKTIVIGVTSSIAAYKSLDLILKLQEKQYDVFVILTPAAAKMILPKEFEKVSGHPVFVDLFAKDFDYTQVLQKRDIDHIRLAKQADVFVIVPATANTIAKLAYGIADNFLTTSVLATTAQILMCPAMNTNMWFHKATQKNIQLLRELGYHIIEPTRGVLACNDVGVGKLENIPTILKAIESLLAYKTHLKGKKILVTAGATKEHIDDVRFITNASSGKMGVALAECAYLEGADVLLLRAESAMHSDYPIREKTFVSSNDLDLLLQKYVKKFDYILHVAAIGDFSLANTQKGKLPSTKQSTLMLVPQKKLLASIKTLNPKIHLACFKAEYKVSKKELVQRAITKLHQVKADLVIANDVGKKSQGFGSDNNEVFVVHPSGKYQHIPKSSKKNIAKEILSIIFPQE